MDVQEAVPDADATDAPGADTLESASTPGLKEEPATDTANAREAAGAATEEQGAATTEEDKRLFDAAALGEHGAGGIDELAWQRNNASPK